MDLSNSHLIGSLDSCQHPAADSQLAAASATTHTSTSTCVRPSPPNPDYSESPPAYSSVKGKSGVQFEGLGAVHIVRHRSKQKDGRTIPDTPPPPYSVYMYLRMPPYNTEACGNDVIADVMRRDRRRRKVARAYRSVQGISGVQFESVHIVRHRNIQNDGRIIPDTPPPSYSVYPQTPPFNTEACGNDVIDDVLRRDRRRRKVAKGLCCLGWIVCCPLFTLVDCVREPFDSNDDMDDLEDDYFYPCIPSRHIVDTYS